MWQDLQPNEAILIGGLSVSFSADVLRLLARADPSGKHWRAIEKGRVPARGSNGLVASELAADDVKTKVLGRGGDLRLHARRLADGTLHFDRVTRH